MILSSASVSVGEVLGGIVEFWVQSIRRTTLKFVNYLFSCYCKPKRFRKFLLVPADLVEQAAAAQLRGNLGMFTGAVEVALGDIDFAQRHVGIRQQGLDLQSG